MWSRQHPIDLCRILEFDGWQRSLFQFLIDICIRTMRQQRNVWSWRCYILCLRDWVLTKICKFGGTLHSSWNGVWYPVGVQDKLLPFAVIEVKKPCNTNQQRENVWIGKQEGSNVVAGQVFDAMSVIQLHGFPRVCGMISTANHWRLVGKLTHDEQKNLANAETMVQDRLWTRCWRPTANPPMRSRSDSLDKAKPGGRATRGGLTIQRHIVPHYYRENWRRKRSMSLWSYRLSKIWLFGVFPVILAIYVK
jgi:hypothetical protein